MDGALDSEIAPKGAGAWAHAWLGALSCVCVGLVTLAAWPQRASVLPDAAAVPSASTTAHAQTAPARLAYLRPVEEGSKPASPAPPAEPPIDGPAAPVIPALRPAERAPVVAIVLDDMGLDVQALARAIDLPAPVTLSFLPYAQDVTRLEAAARAAGHETFLHIPMEPKGLADPGPMALASWQGADEIAARTLAGLERTPGVRGVNNHMGSRFTGCRACVDAVVAALDGRDLVALDSLTTADSVFALAAQEAGLTALTRDVFLDHVRDETAIASALMEAEALARERGWAVVIGHPYDETLDALEHWMAAAPDRGIEVGTAGEAAARARAAAYAG